MLGHAIGGIRGTYDKYAYQSEMLSAYEKLAALIERIASPATDTVVPLRRKKAAG